MQVSGDREPEPGRSRWLQHLSPRDDASLATSVLSPAAIAESVGAIGPGPTGWAVELGADMARHITEHIPALAVDGVAQEIRAGCEALGLGVLRVLGGDGSPAFTAPVELLQGPAEVVGRGIGVEEMLRSIQLGHAFASTAMMASVERVVPPEFRFAETARITATLFAVVELVTEEMLREFSRARDVWVAGVAAARMEIVQDVLAGAPVTPADVLPTLGYDLSRRHTGLVLWLDDAAALPAGRLPGVAQDLLRSAGCSASLVLPVGRRRVWAWGSSLSATAFPPELWTSTAPPVPGLGAAAGTVEEGPDGFRATHAQAVEAAALGALATSGRWFFDYADVDFLAILVQRLDVARRFVRRELGALAEPGETAATLRRTLACYLDAERSLSTAAETLNVARNTVAYRVRRATELRGRDVSDRRMQLQAALTLAEEFGDAVLDPGAPPGLDPDTRT